MDLYFLGTGYPMYFDFLKSSLLILFMIFISSGAYNVFSNSYLGDDCKSSEETKKAVSEGGSADDICTLSWATQMSLANKRNNNNLVLLQDMMNLITIITMVFILQFLRRGQRVTNEECD